MSQLEQYPEQTHSHRDASDVVRRISLSALFVALTAVGGYLSFPVPLGPVPVVLQNLFVFLTGLLLPPGHALKTMILYLFLGALGLPVFAGGAAGPGVFLGPTGGYLLGFAPAAFIIAVVSRKITGTPGMILGVILGGTCIYLSGVPVLQHVTGIPFPTAIMVGVAPFIPGDILKGIVVVGMARLLGRTGLRTGTRIRSGVRNNQDTGTAK
jgi:biotin transport system substrate-specific component